MCFIDKVVIIIGVVQGIGCQMVEQVVVEGVVLLFIDCLLYVYELVVMLV